MEEKQLFESSEDVVILQICEILEENNISYIRRNDGADSYLNLAWGSSNGVTKIFVSSEDYERAMNLIEVFNGENIEYEDGEIPEELKEVVDEKEMEKDINKYKNMKKILYAWAPLTMLLIAIIIFVIASQIYK